MNQRIYFTILIYIKEGKEELFHSYEKQALPLIEKSGGRFELMMKPEAVNGDLNLPDEIHVLSFDTEDGFNKYRQDPKSIELAPLRIESVSNAIFLRGNALSYLKKSGSNG